MTTSQAAISAAIKLLQLNGYTVSRPVADPKAWDYTLVRKYQPNQTAKEIPTLADL